jgi:predicted tellurium resistance membrane protein TerC
MGALLTDPSAWLSLATLSVLEIVLGIDNVVFLSILVARLPSERQALARTVGLGLAMLTRIALLLSVTWLATLTAPLASAFGREFSGRELVLGAGGVFLLWKSVVEIHASVEGPRGRGKRPAPVRGGVTMIVMQIALIDIVFSFDSVFTAVGLVQQTEIMIAAIVIAVLFMMLVARRVSDFIEAHPTIKVLALAFLILIGVALVAEAFEFHIPKGYLYVSMAFALAVEFLNGRVRRGSGVDRRPGSR